LFVREKIRKGEVSGSFNGAVLLADIVGFTSRFDRMTDLGAEGAELISSEVSSTLSAVVEACADFGGFPVSFAGDAVTVVFPDGLEAATAAHRKVNLISREYVLPLRISVGEGRIVWNAVPMEGWTFYSFQGSAVRQALAPDHSGTEEQASLPVAVDESSAMDFGDLPSDSFISRELFAGEINNEFRQVINIFLSLENRGGSNCPTEFQHLVLRLAEDLGGFVSGLEAGKEDYHILVVFGAPVSNEDDSRRADYFLQQVFAQSNGRVKAGIAMGLVFSGLLKTPLLESYTVLGPSVNLAARLHSVAEWNSVYSGPLFNRVSRLKLRRTEEITLKGISLPVQAMVISPWQKRMDSTDPVPPLIERGPLLEKFEALLREDGVQLLITGVSGIGKTRFAEELCAKMEGVYILHIRSEGISGEGSGIHSRWLGEWMGFDPAEDGLASFREKLYSFIGLLEDLGSSAAWECADELLRAESVLAAMAGLQWEKSLYQGLDPRGRFQNTVSVTAAFIKGHCLLHRTVMVFDDIQWLDTDSVTFLAAVIKELKSSRPAVLLLARPGLNQTIKDLGLSPEETGLPALSPDGCRSFLQWSLSRDPTDKLLDWFHTRTEGIPFFMEQYAMMLTSALDPPDVESFPGSIHALLVARLDRLDPVLKLSVLTASVLGRVFDPRVLRDLLQETSLDSVLRSGETERIWEHTADGLFSFVHVLLQEAAYNLQLHSERKKLHKKAAEVMKSMWSSMPEKARSIAWHLEKSDQNEEAASRYFIAGKYSYSRRLITSCLEQMRKVLDLSKDASIRLKAHETIYELYVSTGDLDLAGKAIESAARESLVPEDRARIQLMRANLATNIGKSHDAEALLDGIETVNPLLRAEVLNLRGRILMLQARTEDAMTLLLDVHEEFKNGTAEQRLLAVKALGNASGCMLRLDMRKQAEKPLKQVLSYAVRTGNLVMETLAVGNLALVYKYLSGRQKDAISMTRRHLELAKRTGSRLLELQAMGNLGSLLEMEASTPEVFELLESAVGLSRKYGGLEALSISLANLGRAFQRVGKLEKALDLMKASLTVCEEQGIDVHRIDYTFEAAHILLDLGRLDEAEDLFSEISGRSGIESYDYSIAWYKGKLLRLRGKREESRKVLTEGLKTAEFPELKFNLLEQLYLLTGDRKILEECLEYGEEMQRSAPRWYFESVLDRLRRETDSNRPVISS